MKKLCLCLGLLFPFVSGCPSLIPSTDSPSGEDADKPADAVLQIADGAYAGTVLQTLTTASAETAVPLTIEKSGYVIATVTAGQVRLLRFGTSAHGQFTSWRVEEGQSHEIQIGLGQDWVRSVRTFTSAGQSLSHYSTQTELTDGQASSAGGGEGLMLFSVSGDGLLFDLEETGTYASGPAQGQVQKITMIGTLSKIADLPDPQPPTATGSPGEGNSATLPQAPGPADEAREFNNSGREVLADGSTRTYSGIRQTDAGTDAVAGPAGQTLSSTVETLVRTFVAEDGTTSTETDTSKAYFTFGEDGKGRIFGYQENGQDRFIVEPPEGVPGSVDVLEVGQSRSYTATLDDGTVDVFHETITGTSQVILPSGVFDTFVSESILQRTRPAGSFETARITASIHPMLGLVYRHVEGTVVQPGGAVTTTEFEEYFAAE